MKKNIAVVAGGYSSEYEISIQSAELVLRSLDKAKYNSFLIIIEEAAWQLKLDNQLYPVSKTDFTCNSPDGLIKFDCAFITIHGSPGENGLLQAYFELLSIPYTTCNVLTSALTFNKYYCKNYLASHDIKTARCQLVPDKSKFSENDLIVGMEYPFFVKPNSQGSSFGISMVNSSAELPEAVHKAFAEDSQILIEEYIKGVEITCGLFQNNGEIVAMPLTEIITENVFFDYEAKYTVGKADEITPARITNEQTTAIQNISKKIYEILECRGLVRIDYILKDNTPYLIEVNTTPGLSVNSIIPKMIKAMRKKPGNIFDILINEGLRVAKKIN